MVGSVAAVLLIGIIIWLVLANFAAQGHPTVPVSPTASSTAPFASTTPPKHSTATTVTYHAPVTKSYLSALTIDSRDTIASWKLQITESTTTKEKLQTQIKTLTGDIRKGHYSNFNIYTQIAQDYELLGNGKSAYDFYMLAAKVSPANNGLAWNNIGNLMEQLGAYHTARNAYAASVALSPKVEQFWVSYLNFLSVHETLAPTTAAVFSAAARATNSATNVLIATANWEAAAGNTQAAITNWRLVRPKVGTAQQKAIDAKITSLQK